MQVRPSLEELLLAIADFVEQDVRPQLADPALSFRCLIAANLARGCVLERRMEEWHDGIELEGLRALLDAPTPPSAGRDARREELDTLNARLAESLRGGESPPDELVRAHLRRTLSSQLAITNPRFDTEIGW